MTRQHLLFWLQFQKAVEHDRQDEGGDDQNQPKLFSKDTQIG